jgi:hypothetical protein
MISCFGFMITVNRKQKNKGGDWLRQGSEDHRGMPGYCLPANKRKLNTTADSFEYALAA